jgi:peptidoglycan/xylan/chitin deacetylase (PgdA/CDA1 family)
MSLRRTPGRGVGLLALTSILLLACGLAGCGASGPKASPGQSDGSPAKPHAPGTPASVKRLAVVRRPLPRAVRVPILTWHRVTVYAQEHTKSVPDETVEPDVFASEIQALASHGFHAISQLQLYDALFHGTRLPSSPVLLTVDDGYVDDVKTILPILQAHHFVASFYIITGRFHEPGFLNPTEIRRLAAAGMDIGAHTRTHVPLTSLPLAQVRSQIFGSRDDLERVLGHPVQWFAYPFGSFDSNTEAQLAAAGFVLAVSTRGGTQESSLAPLAMPRIHIGRSASASTVLACASAPAACSGEGE